MVLKYCTTSEMENFHLEYLYIYIYIYIYLYIYIYIYMMASVGLFKFWGSSCVHKELPCVHMEGINTVRMWHISGKILCLHSLFQGIFPTQGSNLSLWHCRQILYCWTMREAQNQTLYNNKSEVFSLIKHKFLWNLCIKFHVDQRHLTDLTDLP